VTSSESSRLVGGDCPVDFQREVLGAGLVDKNGQRVRWDLFEGDMRDDLIRALLAPTPELTTRAEVTEQQADEIDDDDETDAGEADAAEDGTT
jgi:TATA-binding protein-associated factor Taf7